MEFWVGVAEPDENGGWTHYCSQEGRQTRLRVSHPGLTERVFCPRCGSLVPHEGAMHQYTGRGEVRDLAYDGLYCEHALPDVTCLDLATSNSELDFDYLIDIQEYAVAKLARRHDLADAVQQWARPCGICRHFFAVQQLPVLAFELKQLHEAIEKDCREAQARVRELSENVSSVRDAQGLLRDIERDQRQGP